MHEHWHEVYRSHPEIFVRFRAAEDEGDRVIARLCERAELDGRRLLDLGCGHARMLSRLAGRTRLAVGVDNAPALLGLAPHPLPVATALVAGDARTLPFADRSFEVVTAAWMLAYLGARGRREAVAEALRVLVPGGALWAVEGDWRGDWAELREVNTPDRWEAAPLVGQLGFEVVEVVETRFCFATLEAARDVLSALVGETALRWLASRPEPHLGQRVALLRLRKR